MSGLADVAGWYVACRSEDLLRDPIQRVVHGTPLAVFRTGDGVATALVDRCPHRSVPLSRGAVEGELLRCCYHGWAFDRDGVCRDVPGLVGEAEHPARNATAVPLVEQDGLVWVRGGATDAASPMRMPHVGAPGYRTFVWETRARSTVADAAENLLDGTHTHFVHGGWIQRESRRKPTTVVVRRGPTHAEAEYVQSRQSGVITRLFGRAVDQGFGRFLMPGIAQLEYLSRGHTRLVITACFTPTSPGHLAAYGVVTGRAVGVPTWLVALALKPMFRRVLAQDARVLAVQREAIEAYPEARYVHTDLDVLGPHIRALLAGRVVDDLRERTVVMHV